MFLEGLSYAAKYDTGNIRIHNNVTITGVKAFTINELVSIKIYCSFVSHVMLDINRTWLASRKNTALSWLNTNNL
jgi:hypothetical protein